MKRKIIAIGIIAAFASGLLGGCGSNDTPPADSSTAEATHTETQTDSSSTSEEAYASDDNVAGQTEKKPSPYDQLMELRAKQDLDSLNPDDFAEIHNLQIYILAESDSDIHDIESLINTQVISYDCGSNIYECYATVEDPIDSAKKIYEDDRVLYATPIEPVRPD